MPLNNQEREARIKAINEYLDTLSLEILQKIEEILARKDELLEKLFA